MEKSNSLTYPLPLIDRQGFVVPGSLSHSKLSKYERCPFDYKLHYIDGARALRREEYFALGSGVHSYLEGAGLSKFVGEDMKGQHRNGRAYSKRYIEGYLARLQKDGATVDPDHMQEIKGLASEIDELGRRAWEYLQPEKWTIMQSEIDGKPLIEYSGSIDITRETAGSFREFVYAVDLVARDEHGHVWLIDYKTRQSAFTDHELEEASRQFALYQYALKAGGVLSDPIAGTITFQILDRLPEAPRVLKNGGLSRDKSQCCDWKTYKSFLIAAGKDPADYADMEAALSSKEFHRLTKNYRGDREVLAMWAAAMATARHIGKAHTEAALVTQQSRSYNPLVSTGGAFPPYFRGGHMGCKNCDKKPLCFENMRGGDAAFILSTQYTVNGK